MGKRQVDDWNQLKDILNDLDEIDKQTLNSNEDGSDVSAEAIAMNKNTPFNPCEDHECGWGKECVLTTSNQPECECRRQCPVISHPDEWDKVCSSQNETFPSLCDMYRERCLCKRGMPGCMNDRHAKAHLEYLGACKNLELCTDELMEQFPQRMADWLFEVMKDLKNRQTLHGDKWKEMISEAQHDDSLRHVYPVIWKFCDLDQQPHDKTVTHQELIPITAPVMPMESCIKPFLHKCDEDGNNQITLMEWGKCLGLSVDDITEQC
jgi:hypothetical protein